MAQKGKGGLRTPKKTNHDRKNSAFVFMMAMLVIVTMLISGLYYMGSGDGNTIPANRQENHPFNAYEINQIPINESITVRAEEPMMELVAIPKAQCVSMQAIGWVYNTSVPGLRSVMLDAVNPGRNSAGDVCGTFLFFKFAYNAIDEKTVPSLNSELVNRLGDYTLKRSYVGILPVNLSGPGTDRIYVIGSTDISRGESVQILLFQKTSDGNVFALERSRIADGPTVPATVLQLTDIMLKGAVPGNYKQEEMKKRINVTNSRLTPASFMVNGTPDNQTLESLSSLPDVSVEKTENQTVISYNASMEKTEDILKENNITYAKTDGSVILQIPLNTSLTDITAAAKAAGITDLEVKKIGILRVPQLVRINGKIVPIENSEAFNAVLGTDAKVGDKVNISLSTMQFGDQIFILGGSQAE